MINYENFERSLKRLAEQFDNYQTLESSQPELMQQGVAESVTRRFGFCLDRLIGVLNAYLKEELGIAEPPNSPKPILRLAHENNLISSPDNWFKYLRVRNNISNDYNGVKAKACVFIIPNFMRDATELYQMMTGDSSSRLVG